MIQSQGDVGGCQHNPGENDRRSIIANRSGGIVGDKLIKKEKGTI